MMRRAIVLLSLILPWSAGCSESTSEAESGISKQAALTAKPVTLEKVSRRNFERELTATGSLIPVDTARIRALEPGPLAHVPVEIGDRVTRGQTLFRVRQIEAQQAVELAEAQRATAEAVLKDLQAWRRPEEVDALEAQVERARVEARRLAAEKERAAILLERGAISNSQWDQVSTAAEAAEAELRVAGEQLRIAQAGPTKEQLSVSRSRVREAEARLQEARQRLDDTSVEAPFSGIVTGRFLKPGDYVQKGQEVVELSDTSRLEAEMQVPERYSGTVQTGISVDIDIASIRAKRSGEVVAVNEAIDQATRTFLVKVAVDNTDGSIKAGAFCSGIFRLSPVRDAVAVPASALAALEGQTYVWVAEDNIARRLNVTIGERSGDWIEVLQGLRGDEEVVTVGLGALSDGDSITTGHSPPS